MAKWITTYNTVLKHEGGYARARAASGETYKGIDRKYHPNWRGWVIIDQIKAGRKGKGIKEQETFNFNTQLEKAVSDFYKDYLGKMVDVEAFVSQDTANMVADFLTHKQYDAVKVINKTAQQLGSVATAATKVTPDIVNTANGKASEFYKQLRNNRIAYYKNPSLFGSTLKFSTPYIKAFVARVNRFPVAIPLAWNELIRQLKDLL